MAGEEQQAFEVVDGLYLNAAVRLQCGRCLEMGREQEIIVELANDNPGDADDLEEFFAQCLACSAELGKPVGVPLTLLVGRNVERVLGADDVDGDPTREPQLAGDMPAPDDEEP